MEEATSDVLSFARSYQIEALEMAIKQNTIVFLETGSGKTLIAIMLLRSYSHSLRAPSPYKAVFLVPTVVLVSQQAEAVKMYTDLKVGKYWGEMGVDFWDAATWKLELEKHEVLVMTPMVLLNALRHSFISVGMIKVLIYDECHNAKKNHPYACIMKEFYHPFLQKSELPRIFGMTASPIKAKGSNASSVCWKEIQQLENLMNSKVYTCINQSVLADYISFPNVKFKFYEQIDSPFLKDVRYKLFQLVRKHVSSIIEDVKQSAYAKLEKLASTFYFCVTELGLWLASKAAESFSSVDTEIFIWWKLNILSKNAMESFSLDAKELFSSYFHSESVDDVIHCAEAGFLSKKVFSLFESLLEYRDIEDLRCIIFVERVVTAIALESFLNELNPKYCKWTAKYIAGNQNALQSQSRNKQNDIVEEFRRGNVNIIVATSILEEGLDVQSCNLVVRFDPSSNVCSFIQSRGRARMRNSDFILMVKRGDASALARAKTYIASVDIMRGESLKHTSLPCNPIELDKLDDVFYRVESTGALVNLRSSIALIYFYCSRLPSDGYFKSLPRVNIDEFSGTCTLQLPTSSPLPSITVTGDTKLLKRFACLEACIKLHQIGALTDNLVPDIVVEEDEVQALENELYDDEHAIYVPPELVNNEDIQDSLLFHYYLIVLKPGFISSYASVNNVVLIVNNKLDLDPGSTHWGVEVKHGTIGVELKYLGTQSLTPELVHLCRVFQAALFRALLDHNYDTFKKVLDQVHMNNDCTQNIKKVLDQVHMNNDCTQINYLILPATSCSCESPGIDWNCVKSAQFPPNGFSNHNCSLPGGPSQVHTKNGLICLCMLESCLVHTPHNGHMYCISGRLDLNSNSHLSLHNGDVITYKQYFKTRHGIDLQYEKEVLLNAIPLFHIQGKLQRFGQEKQNDNAYTCELPPELCHVIMSPLSVSTVYTFSVVPLIMHRIESLLVGANLKRICADHYTQSIDIPTTKVLEAITTKKCQEAFHLESLETLGDSFLKYAVSHQLFQTNRDQHEGLLSLKKEKIISNNALCKLGCRHKIPGFIRNDMFEPKTWCIPGDPNGSHLLEEEWLAPGRKMYKKPGTQKLKAKKVADVVEALIGAFLSCGGEIGALSFMKWLGIEVDFSYVPYKREFQVDPAMLVNINHFQHLLKYTFHDPSLLVEALTHGSYMMPEISRCYQRLEFLGDAVLDHLITLDLYSKYPNLSPGMLTNMRSASVNNECYAYAAIRVELHKHILHASQKLHKDMAATIHDLEKFPPESTFGWEVDVHFPKVMADVIESLAGAIFVDSGYDKDVVYECLKPLLGPLVTPETLKIHPVQELQVVCQKHHFLLRKPLVSRLEDGTTCYTLEVEANGVLYCHKSTANDKNLAQKIASRAILKSLKDSVVGI